MNSVIAVVDYGMGNLRSVAKAVEHVVNKQTRVLISDDAEQIRGADRVIVPGQGAAKDCMTQLAAHGLTDAVLESLENKPFLGICMGLQLLLTGSEENAGTTCLGVYPGSVKAFPDTDLKVPHMGWNNVHQLQSHALFEHIQQDARFYFVHSYYVEPADKKLIAASCGYGLEFCAAIAKENVFACQFHPEKSAADGLQLLENFTQWNGSLD